MASPQPPLLPQPAAPMHSRLKQHGSTLAARGDGARSLPLLHRSSNSAAMTAAAAIVGTSGAGIAGAADRAGGPQRPSVQHKDINFFSLPKLNRASSTLSIPELHAVDVFSPTRAADSGMRRTQEFMWNASFTLLKENSGKLPFLESPTAEMQSYILDEEEEKERAKKLREKMQKLGKSKSPKKSKLSALTEGVVDKIETRNSSVERALALDRNHVMTQLQTMVEPPETRNKQEQLVKERSWNAAFAPIPSPRRLLPNSFFGDYPPMVFAAKAPSRKKKGAIEGLSLGIDLPTLHEEELEETVRICRLFPGLLATKAADGSKNPTPLVLSRPCFCRMICAMNGLSIQSSGPTKLVQAARSFDMVSERIPNRWGPHFGGASITGISLDSDSMLRAESPIHVLFSKLLHDMATGMNQKHKYAERLSAARARLFGTLLPEAERYVEERAVRLRGTAQIVPETQRVETTEGTLQRSSAKPVLETTLFRTIRPKDHTLHARDLAQDDRTPSSPSRGPYPHSHGHKPLIGKSKSKVAEVVVEEPSENADLSPAPEANPLYKNTFDVLKGEMLSSQLLEPEILHFLAEFSELFRKLFRAYSDVTAGTANDGVDHTHMSFASFIRFCSDFKLFPRLVDLQTIHWLYYTAEGWEKLQFQVSDELGVGTQKIDMATGRIRQRARRISPSAIKGDSMSRSMSGTPSPPRQNSNRLSGSEDDARSPRAAMTLKRRRAGRRQNSTAQEQEQGVLWRGKFFKEHLRWVTKEPSEMSQPEHQSLMLLCAMDDFLTDKNLDLYDVFAYFDPSSTGFVTRENFQTTVMFMFTHFEERPSSSDVAELAGRLILPPAAATVASHDAAVSSDASSPPPLPVEEVRQASVLEVASVQMAVVAARKHKEGLFLAINPFVKDYHKLSKTEVDAYTFFNGLWKFIENRDLSIEEFIGMITFDQNGLIHVDDLKLKMLHYLRMLGVPTQAVVIEHPFEILQDSAGKVSRDNFRLVLEQVREAKAMREASGEAKLGHFANYIQLAGSTAPGVTATSSNAAAPDRKRIFGAHAFSECLLKIALLHLSTGIGAAGVDQSEQPTLCKAMWLLLYFHWQLEAASSHNQAMAPAQKRDGPQALQKPRYVVPLQRLLVQYQELFGGAPGRPPPSISKLSRLKDEVVAIPRAVRPCPPSPSLSSFLAAELGGRSKNGGSMMSVASASPGGHSNRKVSADGSATGDGNSGVSVADVASCAAAVAAASAAFAGQPTLGAGSNHRGSRPEYSKDDGWWYEPPPWTRPARDGSPSNGVGSSSEAGDSPKGAVEGRTPKRHSRRFRSAVKAVVAANGFVDNGEDASPRPLDLNSTGGSSTNRSTLRRRARPKGLMSPSKMGVGQHGSEDVELLASPSGRPTDPALAIAPEPDRCRSCAERGAQCGWGHAACSACCFADVLLQACLAACPLAPAPKQLADDVLDSTIDRAQAVLAEATVADAQTPLKAGLATAALPRFRDRTLLFFATAC